MNHATHLKLVRSSYLFVVMVCALVVGVGGWFIQYRDTNRLIRTDHVACERLKLVAANQRFMLRVMSANPSNSAYFPQPETKQRLTRLEAIIKDCLH